MVIGGSIGTGLFVGSGSALAAGGPAGVLIAWILIGFMLINVTQVCDSPSLSTGGVIDGVDRRLERCRSYTLSPEASTHWQCDF